MLAKADDAFVGGADVGFDAGVVDFLERVARGADKNEQAEFFFGVTDGRKVDAPEIELLVEESDAVGVLAGLFANVADDADFGFAIFFGPAKDKLLLRGELVAGKKASAVKAEENSSGAFREHAAVQIGTDEEDRNFFRDAGRATHNLWWQLGGQRQGGTGDNLVPGQMDKWFKVKDLELRVGSPTDKRE
jgi:hypothetical protein